MNPIADSSSADDQDDHGQPVLEPSGSSSEFVDQSDTNSDESKLSARNRISRVRHATKISPRKETTVNRGSKGKTSRKHYSDQYRELFRDTVTEFESGSDGLPSVNLLPTQLGTVQWRPSEKERFFRALSRKSRLDEPGLALTVGKSELEIRDYLIFLREREAERHLFEKQTKRISHADIPAAIEVSEECEIALEQAADALANFQEQYDTAVAEQQHPGTWLIDWDTARALDEQVLHHEEAGTGRENLSIPENVPAEGLFRLSNWLELSERVFMNSGPPQLHANWQNVASEDERPALTCAVFSDFHDLTVGITRRLMQTCLFLAESRMRSIKGHGYNPKPSVKEQDVIAALEVLGMTRTLSDTFLGVARRNSLRVVRGSHDKGSRMSQVLTYDEVEKELSKRKKSARGRRSVSRGSRSSGMSSFADDDVDTEDHQAGAIAVNTPMPRDASPSLVSIQDPESDVSMSDIDSSAEDSLSGEYGGLSFHASTSRQKRRQIYLEAQQDAYMEDLDRLKSEEEERRLWQIVGRDPPTPAKTEMEKDLGVRPKTLRKTREDLADWQGAFAAEWEVFRELVPEQEFIENGRLTKRPRLEDECNQESSFARPVELRSLPVRTVEPAADRES